MIFKFRNLENGQAQAVPAGEYSIGRDDQAYVHLEDLSVSRVHAFLINENGRLYVEDNGSANGTLKDNEFISGRVPLKVGDIVYIGAVPFRVDPEVLSDAGEPVSRQNQLVAVDKTYVHQDTERLPVGRRGIAAVAVPTQAPEQPVVLRRSTAAVPLNQRAASIPPVAQPVAKAPLTPQELYPKVSIPEVSPLPWGLIALALLCGIIIGLVLGVLMSKQIAALNVLP